MKTAGTNLKSICSPLKTSPTKPGNLQESCLIKRMKFELSKSRASDPINKSAKKLHL